MLTRFPSARFLLPSAQLSETLASFLPAQVTVETERKKGPGKSQQQARAIMGHEDDNASSLPRESAPWAVNRKAALGFQGEQSPGVRRALAQLPAVSHRSCRPPAIPCVCGALGPRLVRPLIVGASCEGRLLPVTAPKPCGSGEGLFALVAGAPWRGVPT